MSGSGVEARSLKFGGWGLVSEIWGVGCPSSPPIRVICPRKEKRADFGFPVSGFGLRVEVAR